MHAAEAASDNSSAESDKAEILDCPFWFQKIAVALRIILAALCARNWLHVDQWSASSFLEKQERWQDIMKPGVSLACFVGRSLDGQV